MNEAGAPWPELDALRASGAAQRDPVGWHYIEALARRTPSQTGLAQRLLQAKLAEAVQQFAARMSAGGTDEAVGVGAPDAAPRKPLGQPSPLALLLQDIGAPKPAPATGLAPVWPAEKPQIRQFKKQLSQISVQKQVSQALAQAPQNAGPINSHMLVLRSLGLMRQLSPDYLNRFMGYIDTLLCLDEAGRGKATPKKTGNSKAEK